MKLAYSIIIFFLVLISFITFYSSTQNQNSPQIQYQVGLPANNNAVNFSSSSPISVNSNCVTNQNPILIPANNILPGIGSTTTCNNQNNNTVSTTTDILALVLTTTGIFIALGLLAGAFGVGSFANVITYTGIAMAIEGGVNVAIVAFFSSIPPLLWGIINGVFVIFWIILIMDGLSNRPSAEAE